MKSKRKYFFIIVFAAILVMFFVFENKTKAENTYTRVTIYKGDTLWKIAKEYGPKNKDIRKTIYEIKKINNLETSILIPGEQLIIPAD
ncbi:LysM domain-containing protein [Caloramator quimbayensis]|uniref:LysM domain-containing protein n=1 Tax=Caloramator quimbayensis TaxID=1147123 RepID=A0A1T4XB58_9CLOT|nr:LysM peptidoglycan-binding domain-containing protein [Caloramator quimbayensis]SKA86677.1 LysM domain-containing protein [Caloramator quimbayensis]